MAGGFTSTNQTQASDLGNQNYKSALSILTTLFFMWGFLTCLNDILIPHLKAIFDMDYTQTMLIQFTFFGAYAIMSIPASWIIGKIGYQKGIVVGLATAGVGAFLFYPASIVISYGMFLFAFFTLATGITVLQVAANPYVAILGKPETASSRLTLTQAFNSLGTTTAPIIGAVLILGGTFYSIAGKEEIVVKPSSDQIVNMDNAKWQEFVNKQAIESNNVTGYATDKAGHIWFQTAHDLALFDGHSVEKINAVDGTIDKDSKGILVEEEGDKSATIITNQTFSEFQREKAKTVQLPYIGLGVILLLIAVFFMFVKLPVITSARPDGKSSGSAWKYPHLVLGAVGIFVYVGAEVSIGSFLVNFLGERSIAGLNEMEAAKFVALFWGGAMVGRFQGALSMNKFENKMKQYGLSSVVLVFGYLLAWYITGNATQALIFAVFVIVNFVASMFGKNKPNRTLAVFAFVAMVLVALTIFTNGYIALWTVIAVGLFNSIMFPTIFTLAIDDLGKHTSQGSGILNTAIVGGAIIPLAMGALADAIGIQQAFFITLICYGFIFFYAVKGYKMKPKA